MKKDIKKLEEKETNYWFFTTITQLNSGNGTVSNPYSNNVSKGEHPLEWLRRVNKENWSHGYYLVIVFYEKISKEQYEDITTIRESQVESKEDQDLEKDGQ